MPSIYSYYMCYVKNWFLKLFQLVPTRNLYHTIPHIHTIYNNNESKTDLMPKKGELRQNANNLKSVYQISHQHHFLIIPVEKILLYIICAGVYLLCASCVLFVYFKKRLYSLLRYVFVYWLKCTLYTFTSVEKVESPQQ